MPRNPLVDEYMATLEHPYKAEVAAVREVILGVSDDITEQIKWNAPTFSYKGYIASFNLHSKLGRQLAHLVFHNGIILDDPTGLLEGDYPDRRMAYFNDMNEVVAGADALRGVVQDWIRKMDGAEQ
ncbi:MAG TPA: DUF1801 domain-containing protein [Trueperaceae bacterium]|nr:DUF1801 domain-containing protein [Trueperaceae bacterium]